MIRSTMECAIGNQRQERQRGIRFPEPMGEDGVGLIEVLVALTIFLISFLPLVMFLPTGWKIIVNSEDQRFATALAYSTLQNDQQSPFPGTTWYVGTGPQTWTGVSGTPPAGAPNTTVPGVSTTTATQGGVTFQIYAAGGWCVADTTNVGFGNGTVTSSTPASYHVVVKVGWGPGISMSSTHVNVVIDSTELSSVSGAPASTTACPLGLA